jgi:hypothetical protein
MSDLLMGVPMQYEPKRPNRFFAEFPVDIGIEVWKIRKFKRPSLTIGKTEIPYMNQKTYVSGRYEWGEINIDLLDPIAPSTSTQVMEWVRLAAESLTGRMGYAAGYAKNIVLKELDPGGIPISTWHLEQCIITSVDFGENTHDDDGLSNISLTVQPWRCIHKF